MIDLAFVKKYRFTNGTPYSNIFSPWRNTNIITFYYHFGFENSNHSLTLLRKRKVINIFMLMKP